MHPTVVSLLLLSLAACALSQGYGVDQAPSGDAGGYGAPQPVAYPAIPVIHAQAPHQIIFPDRHRRHCRCHSSPSSSWSYESDSGHHDYSSDSKESESKEKCSKNKCNGKKLVSKCDKKDKWCKKAKLDFVDGTAIISCKAKKDDFVQIQTHRGKVLAAGFNVKATADCCDKGWRASGINGDVIVKNVVCVVIEIPKPIKLYKLIEPLKGIIKLSDLIPAKYALTLLGYIAAVFTHAPSLFSPTSEEAKAFFTFLQNAGYLNAP